MACDDVPDVLAEPLSDDVCDRLGDAETLGDCVTDGVASSVGVVDRLCDCDWDDVCEVLGVGVSLPVCVCVWLAVVEPVCDRDGVRLWVCDGVQLAVCVALAVTVELAVFDDVPVSVTDAVCDWLAVRVALGVPVREELGLQLSFSATSHVAAYAASVVHETPWSPLWKKPRGTPKPGVGAFPLLAVPLGSSTSSDE